MIQVSRYSSINFDNDWKLRFQIQADYCQKFATTDKPRVQYVLSADSLLKPFIEVNGVVTQQESLTLNQTDDFIVKEVVLNLASIQPGSEVLLFFAENDSSVHELESLFLVTDETDDTVLIEYTNRRNEFDTIFSTNSLFQFRVEGAFLPQDYTFESQSENFRDQRHVAKTLSGYPIEKKTLSLGGGFGVPRWVASLINNIFSLSNVYVNGDRMVRDEGGSVEMTLLHNDYPLYIYKITLEKSDDITADLVALFRAVDSKKKVARSSGEDIRVYNEFAKSLGISDSKMIRELSTIEEISKNFYIEIDDGSSSNTGKATLALLQKFIFEGWINQPVRTSDDVKFRSVVSSNYKEKNNGWSIDATGISEFADLFLRGVFEVMGDSVFHGDIKSHDYATGALGAGYGLVKDSNGDSLLEVDRLLVRKIAYFVELVIQRMSHVGGQIVLTPASMKCIRVEEFDDYYRCYFESTDGDKTLTNDFVVSDQARCQTFNIKTGTSQNVSNSYYWRLVVGVGDDYIDLSKADCDAGSTVPQADDEIVLLGNRTDATRQSAIVLASYGNDAPYFKLYRGIDSYQLSGKEFLSFSRSQIKMIADELYFSTGESVSTVINGVKADLEETKTEFQGKIDTVDSKVEGIQIGVRNLAPKTKITNDAGATINGYEYTFSAQNTDGLTLNKDIFELNEEYVLSFRMRVNSGTLVNIGGHQAGFSVNNFEINGTKPGGTWQGGIEGGLDTENLIIAHVRKTSDEGNIGLWIQPNRFAGTIVNVTISEISVVKGNKYVGWSPAPEDLEAAAQEAKDLADAAQAAADAADAKADNAQTAADAAKDRLDDWAADSVISPTEKQGLKDEIARIDGDKSEITANYTKYGLGMPTAYNSAHSAYRAVLVTLSASTPETIAIPSDFSTKQVAYYTARTNALTAIAEKAKQVADAAQDAADAAQEAADNAMDKYNNLQIGVRNLLLKSNVEISKQETSMGSYIYSEHLSKGKEYTLTLCYTLGANVTSIGACLVPGGINMSFTTHGEKVVEQKSYTIPEDAGVLSGCMFYQYGATDSKIHWAVLVEGNKAPMQWIAAPEDMEEQLQTVSGTVTTLGSELTNTKVALESYKDKVEEKFTAAATATEEQIENAVLNLQKGMRNLVQQGMFNATGLTDYNAKNLYLTKDLVEGEKYTIVIKATLRGSQVLRIYEQSSQITLGTFIASDFTGGVSKARVITYKPYSDSTMRDVLRLYNYPSSGSAANPMDLEWVCLYEGDIKDTAPDYFVNAPEDLNLEINSVKQSVSAIEQTAENISLRVTTTETKVTTAQNTADAAQAAADNAQSSADSALDAANDAINASNSGKLYVKGTGYNVGGAGVNPPRQVILNNNGVNIAIPTARGMNLITLNRSDLSVGYNLNYDYTTSQVNSLIERLNSLTDNVIVILTSKDSFGVQGDTLTNLLEATSRCGGSGNAAAFDSRVPYALVGIPGIGKGAGIEMFTSSLNTAPAAEISTQIINGIPVGISTQAKNMLEEAKDYTADRTLPTWRGWIDVTQDDDGNPLDENKYYPLTIRLSNRDYTNIRLKVNLNSGTKPSWATHNNGFTVNCEWNAIGSGWGVNPSPLREIIEYSRAFTNTETLKIDNEDVTRTIEPVASIGQLGHYNYEYIYLRGGGKYYFEIQGITYNGSRTEIAAQDIQLHTTTFVPNSLDPDYKIEVLTPEDITIIERTNVTKTEYTAGINNLADKVELYATKKLTFKDGTQEVVDAGNLQVGFDAINGYVGHYDASTGKWNKSGFMVKDSYSGIFSGKANSQDSAIVEVLSSVEVYGDTAAISAAHVVITGETKFVTKGGSGSVVNIFSDKAFSYISGSTHQEVFNINNGVFAVSDYGDVHIGKYSSGGAGILYNYNTSTLSLRGSINITSGSININNGVFKVTNTGAMTATSGKIGGFTIDGTWLRGDNGLSISDELVNINKTDRSVYIGGHPDESVGGKSKLGYFRMTNSPNNIKSGHAISLYCAAPYLTTNVSSESLGSFAFWADGESVLTGLTFWGKYSGATSGTVTITNYDSALYINGDVTLQDGSGLKTSRFSHFILIVNTSSSKRFVRGLVNNGQMTILGYCCKFVVFYGGNFYGISDEY